MYDSATTLRTTSRIAEVVCDMSGAFLAAVTVDWFHVVQMFTKAVDDVRRAEAQHGKLPKSLRWAILKRTDGRLTKAQADALAELETSSLLTAVVRHIKEMLRWIRKAEGIQAGRRRITHFPRHARQLLSDDPILAPVRKAVGLLRKAPRAHPPALDLGRTAMPAFEGLNGLFQAARARTRGYCNTTTFATMIYLIAAPLGDPLHSLKLEEPTGSQEQPPGHYLR